MSLIKSIRGFLSRLSSKRKSNREENEEPLAKRVKRYDLTPVEKFTPRNVENKRCMISSYIIHERVSTTESRNYEFKKGGLALEKHGLQQFIRKYGSAFLNSEGGVVLLGVLDDGIVQGIQTSVRKEMEIIDTIQDEFDMFRPRVSSDLYCVKFVPVLQGTSGRVIHGLNVVEIRIRKGKTSEIYETCDHKVYVRRDGGTQGPLRPIVIKDLAISKYKLAKQEDEKILREKSTIKNLAKDGEYDWF